MLGKQYRYCPNCGKQLYDTAICLGTVKVLCCSDQCRADWGAKAADCVIGKDAVLDEVATVQAIARDRGSWYPGAQRNLRP